MAHLSLKQVKKNYGDVRVIHGADLEVDDGEFVVLVGPSGCGKSTLLRMIAGLEEASAGDILIDQALVNHVPASDRGLAMVFQSYALYPHMSVYKNMAFGLENTRMPKQEIDQRVRHAAEMLRITDYLQRKPKALSGGQRQRVAIGRAIVREPKIFLFDEPLSNLDAELRVAMRKELAALHASIGGTMIYVTHDQTEAMTLADRIVVLNAGNIEQIGSPLDLYNHPNNTFVAGFIGSPRMNLLEAKVVTVDDNRLTVDLAGRDVVLVGRKAPVKPGDPITLGVRPEHLDISEAEAADLDVTVDLAEALGSETYFYATADGLPQLTLHLMGQRALSRGQHLGLKLRTEEVHLFGGDGGNLGGGEGR
ncbi:MAG: ABC transporter ATP-binding protein [Geminicoccaceae bacterium]